MLDHSVEMNSPPAPFAAGPKPWNAYIQQLPASQRYAFTYQLLKKQGDSRSAIVSVISQLDPSPEVRRAVAVFLNGSRLMTSNRSDFSPEDITAMFGGSRFSAFFPWVFPSRLEGTIRTKFIIAVRTAPFLTNNSLNLAWLQEKMDDGNVREGVPEVLGFRPALTHARLSGQLNDDFSDSTYSRDPGSQIRGLIVQGGHERNGHSLFRALTGRGDAQVEEQTPQLMARLENSLRSGQLSRQSGLIRRLFVYNWALDNDSDLINQIRGRAVRVAEAANSFWSLRVAIHNFPTLSVLRQVQAYRQAFRGRRETAERLDRLIADMERFLNVRGQGGGLGDTLRRLPASDQVRDELTRKAEGFADLDAAGKLERLQALRRSWRDIKSESQRRQRSTESYLGDRSLAQAMLAETSQAIENMDFSDGQAGLDRFAQLGQGILAHIVLDDFLPEGLAEQYCQETVAILADPGLGPDAKAEMIGRLFQNAGDQVYELLNAQFGRYDALLGRIGINGTAPKYVDILMRSHAVFLLGKLVEKVQETRSTAQRPANLIDGRELRLPVEVFNPGRTTAVLRLGQSPLELTADEIGVFEEVPAETSALSGIITVGVGARLSHLQLLAKALKIPHAKVSRGFLQDLEQLNGKRVAFTAHKDGHIEIQASDAAQHEQRAPIAIPAPDHNQKVPLSFSDLAGLGYPAVAGPKGMQLARMFAHDGLHSHIPDGFVLPFGFFRQYAGQTGLWPWIQLLSKIRLDNTHLIEALCAVITRHIAGHPLPTALRDQIDAALDRLDAGNEAARGHFYRSDTNIEDLPGFNGAGLNHSVPNVPRDAPAIDRAVREVWMSPFATKSIFWRALALARATVSIAEPSIAVMPTVESQLSGVMVSRGTALWVKGRGLLSAAAGISAVVQEGKPVEEISFEGGGPHRFALAAASDKSLASPDGGLRSETSAAGRILTDAQAAELNRLAQEVDAALGEQEHGWDIEWGIDGKGRIYILQARPNM
jgi:hypothetical protein